MDYKTLITTDELRQTALIAKALSNPVRLYIIKKLAHLNACCYSGDLAEELGIGRSTLSQHLKELKYAGLIQGEIEGLFIKYCLNRKNWAIARQLFADLFKEL